MAKAKIETPNYSEAQLDDMAKKMAEVFKDMEKVKVRIPTDNLNKEDKVVPVCVNGYVFEIPRGIPFEVPQTVYDILEESGYLG